MTLSQCDEIDLKKKKKTLAEFLLEKFFKVQMEYNAWMQFYLHFIWETLVPLQK